MKNYCYDKEKSRTLTSKRTEMEAHSGESHKRLVTVSSQSNFSKSTPLEKFD